MIWHLQSMFHILFLEKNIVIFENVIFNILNVNFMLFNVSIFLIGTNYNYYIKTATLNDENH